MDANAFETLHDLYDQKFLEKKEPQQVIDFFKFLRRNHLRRPDLVLNLASYLRDASQDSLDYWEAIEEMAFRAADVSDYQTLSWCCKHIQGKFGNSWRLQRLLGILHEVRFEYKTAAVIYEKALDSNPACFFVYKRQVAVLRSLGKYEEAIAVLCDYLKIFKLEEESWIELVDLYLEVKRYEEAAFAASELIIMNPTCWIYFFLVAQIYYTIGDKESLVLARKYFCYCCKVQKDCPGVLYGLFLTCRTLARLKPDKDNTNNRLIEYALVQLNNLYQKTNVSLIYTLKSLRQAQRLTLIVLFMVVAYFRKE